MKKLLFTSLLLVLIYSCSNNDNPEVIIDDDSGSGGSTFIDRFEAQFNGNMIAENINNEIDAKVYISETGNFTLESFIGRITGNVELENDIYTITNLSGDGAFESSSFTEGQLILNNSNLILNGNYIDSSPLVINGEVEIILIEEYEQAWADARSKSSVFFSHNELCNASITIDDVTLENLGTHYNVTGALCNTFYYGELFTTKYHQNVDNDISETICGSHTLLDPITEEYNTYEHCVISKFVVDKNTEYTYTVNWDNGFSTTDTFTSADGGQGVTICPINPLEDCVENEEDDEIPDDPIADFEMSPICCPPASASGRHFEYVEIIFNNQSTGEGLEYNWSFGSTEANPTETFSLNNYWVENTQTIGLTVTDSYGNSDYIEKSIEIPTLAPIGTVTYNGTTCNINFYEGNPWIVLAAFYYHQYWDTNDENYCNTMSIPWEALTYSQECDFPTDLSIRINLGGEHVGTAPTMTQVEEWCPTNSNNFYVSFGNYSTFDGGISSGGITLSGVDEGFNMIAGLSLSGLVRNGPEGETRDFSIDLSWIAHACYYSNIWDCP